MKRSAVGAAVACCLVALLAACTTAPAPSPAPSNGDSTTAVPGAAAPARPVAAAGAFPTAATTGFDPSIVLTDYPGDVVLSTPGQVLSGARVNGDVRVQANDVVIRGSEVLGRITNQDGNGHWRFTVESTTVGPADQCLKTGEGAVGVDSYTAVQVHVQGFSDGFRVSGNNVLIRDSFVDLCDNPGAHADGVQGYGGGTGVKLVHNTIDGRAGESENAAVFFADGSLGAEVRDNLLIGGGWTLRLHDQTATKAPQDLADYIVVGNRIAEGTSGYGPTSVDDCDRRKAITWSDNRIVSMAPDYTVTGPGREIPC